MAASNKTERGSVAAAALAADPLYLSFIDRHDHFKPREPGPDEDGYVVGAECFAELVDVLKAAPDDRMRVLEFRIAQVLADAGAARRESRDPAAFDFLQAFTQMAAALIRANGNPKWAHKRVESRRASALWVKEATAKEKAERVARMAAGRKAAAERRALAVLAQFPRKVEVPA